MTPSDFRSWRLRLGLTQAQAAEALDMSRAQIANYEAGEYPSPRTVELACEALEARHKLAS